MFNPVADSDPPSVEYQKMTIWPYDEINDFLYVCKEERHYLIFLLAIYTGMRRGEILGLKWDDIDFSKGTIQVNRTLSTIPSVGYIFTTPKTINSIRSIPIPAVVLNELMIHKQRQEEWKELVRDFYQNQDLVICTNSGTAQIREM
ncbi:site-specific integrase [Ureibacillus sp. GCM10028918]|uniref:site-specific integrase n=1 Tax=Ureibacillus sp. GCM10028918 TaxID=3273429 RepID=UPI0036F199AD